MMHQGEIAERIANALHVNNVRLMNSAQMDVICAVLNYAQKEAFADGWHRGYAYACRNGNNDGDYLPVIRR